MQKENQSHNSELEKINKELGNGEAVNRDLLRSVIGHCNAFIETVSSGNMQELSQGICKENVQQLVATAGKDCKVNIEDNTGKRNHILSSCAETISGHIELCTGNQSLTSFEGLVDVGLNSRGNDGGMQSLEFIAI